MPKYLAFEKISFMKNGLYENSLGNETLEALGFKTIDALEKALELLT